MLRITSGEFRNRRISVPPTGAIRPMLDKPRQAIFSILGQDAAAGGYVIDCFAGTGVLGFEALSRGASGAIFYDREAAHIGAIRELATRLGCQERCVIEQRDVLEALTPRRSWHAPFPGAARLIFLDPPHAMSDQPDDPFYPWFAELSTMPFVDAATTVVFGHHGERESPERAERWKRFEHRVYGSAALSMYTL